MRSISIKGFATLVAVLALAGIVTASASAALPEFRGGELPMTFTGKGHFLIRGSWGGVEKNCNATIKGTLSQTNFVTNTKLSFPETAACADFCINTGSDSTESANLFGEPGYVAKTEKSEVGFDLHPYKGSFIKNCFKDAWGEISEPYESINGSVIGKISPTWTDTTKYTLTYNGSTSGVQQLQRFEGEEENVHQLEGTPVYGKTALVGTLEIEFAQPVTLEA